MNVCVFLTIILTAIITILTCYSLVKSRNNLSVGSDQLQNGGKALY